MLAIYTRLSKDEHNTSNSIKNQTREGKAFAKENNLIEYNIYDEGSGVSATEVIENRPKLFELIRDIKNGKIDKVWMRNQNRLERNGATFYLFVAAVKNSKVVVYFGDGDALDFNDPTTQLQTGFISLINQYQAHLQSDQTKKTLKNNAEEGRVWGVIPYGYRTKEEGKIAKEEAEVKTVKLIFDKALLGWGTLRISTYLNEGKIPTRYNGYKGKLSTYNRKSKRKVIKDKKDIIWSSNTVLNLLKNTWYIGKRIYAGIEYPTPKIIEEKDFKKVQENLIKNKTKGGKLPTYNYLLKGLVICGRCQRNYYGRFKPPKKGKSFNDENYYTCSSKRKKHTNCGNRSISIPFLENLIWGRFFKSRELNKLIEKHFLENNVNDVLSGLEQQLKTLLISLSKYNNERRKTIKLHAKGFITTSQTENDLNRIKGEENQTKSEINNIEEQIKNHSNSILLAKQQTELNDIQTNISFLDKKKLINKYIKEVLISHNDEGKYYEISISFNLSLAEDKYIVTTFKKEVYRDVRGWGIYTSKIDLNDIKDSQFDFIEQTTSPILNNKN